MMIAVAIAGSLVVYAWVMGYIGSSTEKGGKAITIQSIANLDNDLSVFVKNNGEEVMQLEEIGCLYVNGVLVPCTISDVAVSDGIATLNKEETATLTFVDGAALPGEKITVKVTTLSGISADYSGYPAGSTNIPSVPDNFSFTKLWNQTYGDRSIWIPSTRDEIPYALVETSDGGFVIAGESTEPENFSVYKVGWMVKTDKFGNMEWNRTYNGIIRSLVQKSDGGYIIAGYFEGFHEVNDDFWLAKTDDYGNIEWSKTYGGSDFDKPYGGPDRERAYSMVETPDGGYALAGENCVGAIASVDDFIAGFDDFWLVKTDANGNMEWNKTYGGPVDREKAFSLVVTPDGGFAIGGTKTVYDLEREPGLHGIIPSNGTFYWLVKTDAYGNMEWNQTYGGTNPIFPPDLPCLSTTSDGGYILGGDMSELVNGRESRWMLIVKVDEHGVQEWNRTYDELESKYRAAASVVETPDGGYLIAAIGGDPTLLKTNSTGHIEWSQAYPQVTGISHFSVPIVLVATSDGGYALAGFATHYVYSTFGGASVGYDFWLVKIQGYSKVP